jgi:hypothetical protein
MEDTGAGIAYRSERELDAALDRIAGSPELRDELGERGRAAYLERWTVGTHLRSYYRLIRELATYRGNYELMAAAAAGEQDASLDSLESVGA